jgi:hypothetical protein
MDTTHRLTTVIRALTAGEWRWLRYAVEVHHHHFVRAHDRLGFDERNSRDID